MTTQGTTFEAELRRQAEAGLGITARILSGEDIGPTQARTATTLISAQLKSDSNRNGQISRVISLARLGIRDADTRERIAKAALDALLPGALPASDAVAPSAAGSLAPAEAQG